jgi:hypothetical protein
MGNNTKETAKRFCEAYRSEAKHFIKGVNDPLLHQMMWEYAQSVIATIPDEETCTCGVPNDLHATCCGWKNAGVSMNHAGIITEPRHPYFGKTFTQFMNEYQ